MNREDTKPVPARWNGPAHKRDLLSRRKKNPAEIRQKQKKGLEASEDASNPLIDLTAGLDLN